MTENGETILDNEIDRNTGIALNFFWTGFVIYTAGFAISTTYAVSFILCQIVQVLGILLFVPAAVMLIRFRLKNNYLRIVYILYFLWLLSVILRGITFGYDNLKFMFFDAEFGLFRYFVPLFLLFPISLVHYKKIFKVIVVLGLLFIVYDVLFIKNLLDLSYANYDTKFTFEYFTKTLCLPAGFLMLTYAYHPNRRKLLAFLIIAVGAGFAIFRARRALVLMTLIPLAISYMIYLWAGKRKLLILLFSLLIGTSLFFYGIKVYNENRSGVFSLITERMYENTRSKVEKYFYQDMSTQDWIIGKGFNGQYYCPGIDIGIVSGYRGMIETDYLNIILKGGIISLVFLFLIALPAIAKGLFYSKNLLSKAAAVWILLWLLELYPANVNSFTLNHILVWISIGICYSESIRNMPEADIAEVLSN